MAGETAWGCEVGEILAAADDLEDRNTEGGQDKLAAGMNCSRSSQPSLLDSGCRPRLAPLGSLFRVLRFPWFPSQRSPLGLGTMLGAVFGGGAADQEGAGNRPRLQHAAHINALASVVANEAHGGGHLGNAGGGSRSGRSYADRLKRSIPARMARVCSGVLPQQEPTMAAPATRTSGSAWTISSGVCL